MSSKQAAVTQMSLGERYIGMMDLAREPIARVVDALAQAKGGAVYHCAAGKDRTGVISAILLGALGVPDDLIVADYALSSQNIDAIIGRVMNMKGYGETLKAMPADTLHAKPETMEEVVANVASRYGSMSDYLRDSGVSQATLERLRAKCLD
jgi:protein tyrosine/serine phosphatase